MGQQDQTSPRVVRWVGYFCLTLGLAMAAFGVYFVQLGDASTSWPSVEGKVVSVAVRTYTIGARRPATIRSDASRMYYPEVTYSYLVDGKDYTSKRYALGESQEWHAERADAVKAARAFREGNPITVYYDPEEPSSAALSPGGTTGTWVPLLLSTLFIATGALLAFKRLEPAKASH